MLTRLTKLLQKLIKRKTRPKLIKLKIKKGKITDSRKDSGNIKDILLKSILDLLDSIKRNDYLSICK